MKAPEHGTQLYSTCSMDSLSAVHTVVSRKVRACVCALCTCTTLVLCLFHFNSQRRLRTFRTRHLTRDTLTLLHTTRFIHPRHISSHGINMAVVVSKHENVHGRVKVKDEVKVKVAVNTKGFGLPGTSKQPAQKALTLTNELTGIVLCSVAGVLLNRPTAVVYGCVEVTSSNTAINFRLGNGERVEIWAVALNTAFAKGVRRAAEFDLLLECCTFTQSWQGPPNKLPLMTTGIDYFKDCTFRPAFHFDAEIKIPRISRPPVPISKLQPAANNQKPTLYMKMLSKVAAQVYQRRYELEIAEDVVSTLR